VVEKLEAWKDILYEDARNPLPYADLVADALTLLRQQSEDIERWKKIAWEFEEHMMKLDSKLEEAQEENKRLKLACENHARGREEACRALLSTRAQLEEAQKEIERLKEWSDAASAACCYLDKAVPVLGRTNDERIRFAADEMLALRARLEEAKGVIRDKNGSPLFSEYDVREIRTVVRVEGPENHGALMSLAKRLERLVAHLNRETAEKNA
jgi:chromosome segregation ATPase